MTKTKIVETTEKFDEKGKLVEKITREETTEDDTVYYPSYPITTTPAIVPDTYPKVWWNNPTCTTTNYVSNDNENIRRPIE